MRIVAGVVAVVFAVLLGWGVVELRRHNARVSARYDGVLTALERGELRYGSEARAMVEAVGDPVTLPDGRAVLIQHLPRRHEVIILYSIDRKLVGACHASAVHHRIAAHAPGVRWYFCDVAQVQECIQAQVEAQGAGVGEAAVGSSQPPG